MTTGHPCPSGHVLVECANQLLRGRKESSSLTILEPGTIQWNWLAGDWEWTRGVIFFTQWTIRVQNSLPQNVMMTISFDGFKRGLDTFPEDKIYLWLLVMHYLTYNIPLNYQFQGTKSEREVCLLFVDFSEAAGEPLWATGYWIRCPPPWVCSSRAFLALLWRAVAKEK